MSEPNFLFQLNLWVLKFIVSITRKVILITFIWISAYSQFKSFFLDIFYLNWNISSRNVNEEMSSSVEFLQMSQLGRKRSVLKCGRPCWRWKWQNVKKDRHSCRKYLNWEGNEVFYSVDVLVEDEKDKMLRRIDIPAEDIWIEKETKCFTVWTSLLKMKRTKC